MRMLLGDAEKRVAIDRKAIKATIRRIHVKVACFIVNTTKWDT